MIRRNIDDSTIRLPSTAQQKEREREREHKTTNLNRK